MYITLESDYAVRILSVLCKAGVKMDAGTVSREACVTPRFTLKILRKLLTAGLVKSFKGTMGGYMIAKEPKDITLKQVIEAIEGTYVFSRCLRTDSLCSRDAKSYCQYRKAFAEITDIVTKKLDEYNFEDLAVNYNEPAKNNTQNIEDENKDKK